MGLCQRRGRTGSSPRLLRGRHRDGRGPGHADVPAVQRGARPGGRGHGLRCRGPAEEQADSHRGYHEGERGWRERSDASRSAGAIADACADPWRRHQSATAPLGPRSPSPPAGRVGANSVAIGDFNGDRKVDLVTVDGQRGHGERALGNGDGTFGASSPSPRGHAQFRWRSATFNGDGKADLDHRGRMGEHGERATGNGDGTSTPRQAFATGSTRSRWRSATSTATESRPRDRGRRCEHGERAPGNGDGTFGARAGPSPGGALKSAFGGDGDFNGDGKADLVTADRWCEHGERAAKHLDSVSL